MICKHPAASNKQKKNNSKKTFFKTCLPFMCSPHLEHRLQNDNQKVWMAQHFFTKTSRGIQRKSIQENARVRIGPQDISVRLWQKSKPSAQLHQPRRHMALSRHLFEQTRSFHLSTSLWTPPPPHLPCTSLLAVFRKNHNYYVALYSSLQLEVRFPFSRKSTAWDTTLCVHLLPPCARSRMLASPVRFSSRGFDNAPPACMCARFPVPSLGRRFASLIIATSRMARTFSAALLLVPSSFYKYNPIPIKHIPTPS